MDLGDSTRVFEWIKENNITGVKTIRYYAFASDFSVDIYPKNNVSSIENIQSCGYFLVNRTSVLQSKGMLIQEKYSKDSIYIIPSLIGDSCLYLKDEDKVNKVVNAFCNAVKSDNKELAEKYIHFPLYISCNDTTGYVEKDIFWNNFKCVWSNFVNNKKEVDCILFGEELFRLFYYDRSGIIKFKPQKNGDDFAYLCDFSPLYTSGYYAAYCSVENNEEYYNGRPDYREFYARILKIDGEIKITSFFIIKYP